MKNYLALFFLAIILCFSIANQMNAQDDIDALLEGGIADANVLLGAYLEPVALGFGFGLGGGWYSSAKTHRPGGIDLSFTTQFAYAPDELRFYDPQALQLENISFANPNIVYPTALGDAEPTPELLVNDTNGIPISFTGPGGLDVSSDVPAIFSNSVPVPVIQLGVGLIKRTDLKVRYAQDFGIVEDFDLQLWGVGIQHEVGQWIPFIKRVPIDVSVLFAYTDVQTDILDIADENDPDDRAEFDSNAFTFQLLVSKKLSVLTLYAGFGFNAISSDVNILGEYEITSQAAPLVDPIQLSFNQTSGRATFGARLKFGPFAVFTDYTFQRFDTWTIGISLPNFRETKNKVL